MTTLEKIVLLVITTLGFFLRLHHVGMESLWEDEVFDFFIAKPDILGVFYSVGEECRGGLPMHYLLFALMKSFGQSEAFLRIPAVLFSTLAIPVGFFFAKEVYPKKPLVAWVASLVLAGNAFQIAYAQEARFYAWLTLWVLLLWWRFFVAYRTNKKSDWLLYGAVACLASYTHYYTFIVLGCQAAIAAGRLGIRWADSNRRTAAVQALYKTGAVCLGTAVLFIPAVFFFMSRTGYSGEFNFKWGMLPTTLGVLIAGTGWAAWAGVLTILPLALGRPEEKEASRWLAVSILLSLGCILGLNWIAGYFYHFRQLIVLQPLIVLLLSAGLVTLGTWLVSVVKQTHPARWVIGFTLCAVLALQGPGLWVKMTGQHDEWLAFSSRKPQFRQAITYLLEHAGPRDAIVCLHSSHEKALKYYFSNLRPGSPQAMPIVTIEDNRDLLETILRQRRYNRYWLLDDGRFHGARNRLSREDKAWLQSLLENEKQFYQVRVAQIRVAPGPARDVTRIELRQPESGDLLAYGWIRRERTALLETPVKSRNKYLAVIKRVIFDLPVYLGHKHATNPDLLPKDDLEVVWGGEGESALFLPLGRAQPVTMHIRVAPEIPQTLTLMINGEKIGEAEVREGWRVYHFDLRQAPWREGNNLVVFRYGAYVRHTRYRISMLWDECVLAYPAQMGTGK